VAEAEATELDAAEVTEASELLAEDAADAAELMLLATDAEDEES